MDENTVERRNLKWVRILVETRGWKLPSSLQVVAGPFCFAVQLWWEDKSCISTVLPSHGVGAWKLKEDEVALSCAKGSIGSQPSPSVSLQPEKLPPPVLGSRALASDMTGAANPLPMPATLIQASVWTPWPIRAWPVLTLSGLGLGRPKSQPLWELLISSAQPLQ